MGIVVNENDWICSASVTISYQERSQPLHQNVGGRQRVGCGPRRANRSALSATCANEGIDRHVISRRRNGARWAKIKTAIAADDFRT
jgi:hypothetical protein